MATSSAALSTVPSEATFSLSVPPSLPIAQFTRSTKTLLSEPKASSLHLKGLQLSLFHHYFPGELLKAASEVPQKLPTNFTFLLTKMLSPLPFLNSIPEISVLTSVVRPTCCQSPPVKVTVSLGLP
jgi:hypothetical protein